MDFNYSFSLMKEMFWRYFIYFLGWLFASSLIYQVLTDLLEGDLGYDRFFLLYSPLFFGGLYALNKARTIQGMVALLKKDFVMTRLVMLTVFLIPITCGIFQALDHFESERLSFVFFEAVTYIVHASLFIKSFAYIVDELPLFKAVSKSFSSFSNGLVYICFCYFVVVVIFALYLQAMMFFNITNSATFMLPLFLGQMVILLPAIWGAFFYFMSLYNQTYIWDDKLK